MLMWLIIILLDGYGDKIWKMRLQIILLIGNFEHGQYCEFINWLNVMWAACKCDYGYHYDLGHVITENVII